MMERPSVGAAREHSCVQLMRHARQAEDNLNKCPLADEKCIGPADPFRRPPNDIAGAGTPRAGARAT
ncbi:hypothetical protein [Burkholderia territorii]|uniref:hypothetical protein n=1 Tax=Burkholderia territorii TaxID=1503055 RepID=UPI0012D9EDA3|nr:hypothetical protein [Burkholderia territorii]